ncbi:MAG: type II secretion system protein [Pirellulales bacterium]|nr:type II secretion system protein [Pirellulales bacterium]
MNRRGFTIIEMVVAAVLLGGLMIVSLEVLVAAARQRREADRRQTALFEVSNVVESLSARAWEELTPAAAAGVELPADVRRLLPGAELQIEIAASPPEERPPWKRIAVSLAWLDRAGRMLPPVSVATWRYETRGGRSADHHVQPTTQP